MCEQCDKMEADLKRKGAVMAVIDPDTRTPVVVLCQNGSFKFHTDDADTISRALLVATEQALNLTKTLETLHKQRHYADLLIGAMMARLPEKEVEEAAQELEAESLPSITHFTTGEA